MDRFMQLFRALNSRHAALALPLLFCIIPNVVIGYGYVIPNSCIAGVNELTIGYATCILGFIPSYIAGIAIAGRLARIPVGARVSLTGRSL